MIDRETVDRIYAAANIVEVIGDYVTLKRKGVNYQACCPFHNEKTPSFVVSPSKGVYKCFGCGKGGNAVTFVMEHEGISYPEALKMVGKKYGIEVQEKELTPEEMQNKDNRESMFVLNSWAADHFMQYLHETDEGKSVGMSYFRQKRGFSEATIRKFGLGMCAGHNNVMTKAALAAGYKEEFLLSTGLSIKSERDGQLFDRFRERVMFPVHNVSGRIVAFGGRTLRTDKSVAKYQNSPESEIYSKRHELYGLFFAKKAIQQLDYAIMVEGYTDVISMHQSGVGNVVASSGTSLTTEQIRLISRFTRNITIIYDGDSAGIHASLRGIDMVLKEGMNVRVVALPPEDDPDSFARSHSGEQVHEYITQNEEDFLSFKAKLLLRDAGNDPMKRAAVVKDMVQSISQIADNIQRSIFIKECAQIMDIDENLLIGEVARRRAMSIGDAETGDFIRRQQAEARSEAAAAEVLRQPVGKIVAGSSIESLEKEIVRYLLKFGHLNFDFKEGRNYVQLNVAAEIIREMESDNLSFSNPVYNEIFNTYRREWKSAATVGEPLPMHLFVNHSSPEVCNVAVDVLTSEDNYTTSDIWSQKDVHIESTEELLAAGVPKAIALFKSKVIARMIDELQSALKSDDLSDEQMEDNLRRLSQLNKLKVTLARKLQRLIL